MPISSNLVRGLTTGAVAIVQDGRVFVPLRGVFEDLGASVVYANGQINATENRRDIALQIGSTQASVDGQPETIDVAPFIVGESTYVPLRFISRALGATVSWNGDDRVVTVASTTAQILRARLRRRAPGRFGRAR